MQSELQQRNKEIITNESTINILQHDKEDTVSKLQLAEGLLIFVFVSFGKLMIVKSEFECVSSSSV